MNCSDCGALNRDGRRFCGDCGAQLAATCPACGAPDEDGARFCGSCGAEIARATGGTPPSTASPARPPSPDPRSYTPRHLADKILHSKAALEGERKQVTVLFADVIGSTELAEELDPEEWHAILDRFFQILAEGVHRFEGTINQYTGDGIMALFGAPIAHEDHAQRACYAALQLQQEIKRYADALRVERGVAFAVRMGLNSGDVVVGKIGDDLRMDYTAQGATVNLAARMQTLADPGKALLAQATARLAEGFFQLRDLGETRVRGVSVPVRIAELEGVGAYRTRLDRSRARGFSQFVGRSHELALLESALERMLEGHGGVVGVVADAGTGKSRLCAEFVQRVAERGIRLHQAHCPAHGRAIAFLPVLELIRSWFEIDDSDTARDARRKVAGDLTLLGGDFEDVLPLLFEFIGIADAEQPVLDLSPKARQRALYAFIRRLSRARSEREPALLFIDDLHWIDSASDEFLSQLVEIARSTRTLLLLNFRPEYRAEWMSHTHYQQIPLVPLGQTDMAEMLSHLLGNEASLERLPDRIFERTDGNPFFAEEVVQGLVESGSLAGEPGNYRLGRAIEHIQIPPTVQAVLAARIDRLEERDKRVLQTASVIGREVPEPLLRAILSNGEEELATSLVGLQRLEFLFEQALYPEVIHSFKHALTRDVAYDSQLQTRRAELHGRVARALEVRETQRINERSGLIAQHWEAAGDVPQAARWHMRAAEWAGYTDITQAVSHVARVCDLLDGNKADELAPLALHANSTRLNLGFRFGSEQSELDRSYERGLELARQLGSDHDRVVLMERYAAGSLWHRPDPALIALVDEAAELGRSCGNDDAWFTARYRQVWLRVFVDVDYELGNRLAVEIKHDLQAYQSPPISAVGFDYETRIDLYTFLLEIMQGRAISTDEVARAHNDFVERGRALRDLEGEASAHLFSTWMLRVRGEMAAAREVASQQLRLTAGAGSEIYQTSGNLELGLAEVGLGNWEVALPSLQQAEQVGILRPAALAARGLALHRSGKRREGRAISDDAMSLLDARKTCNHYDVSSYWARVRLLIADGVRDHRREIEQRIDEIEKLLAVSHNGAEAWVPGAARAEFAAALGDETEREWALQSARQKLLAVGASEYAERLAAEVS